MFVNKSVYGLASGKSIPLALFLCELGKLRLPQRHFFDVDKAQQANFFYRTFQRMREMQHFLAVFFLRSVEQNADRVGAIEGMGFASPFLRGQKVAQGSSEQGCANVFYHDMNGLVIISRPAKPESAGNGPFYYTCRSGP